MAILTMPSQPAFTKYRFFLRPNTQIFRSPLSGSVQTKELTGAQWMATFELPSMKRVRAAAWIAFLAQLNGRAGRFFAGDPEGATPQGVATGTPLVNGASQTGTSLITDGWTPNQTGILKAGDYLAYDTPLGGREMHLVVADANSDGVGNATFTIAPPIREGPADNATIIVQNPSCVMMLRDAQQAAWDVREAAIYGIAFSCVEAFKL